MVIPLGPRTWCRSVFSKRSASFDVWIWVGILKAVYNFCSVSLTPKMCHPRSSFVFLTLVLGSTDERSWEVHNKELCRYINFFGAKVASKAKIFSVYSSSMFARWCKGSILKCKWPAFNLEAVLVHTYPWGFNIFSELSQHWFNS